MLTHKRGTDGSLIIPNYEISKNESIGNVIFGYGDLFNPEPNTVLFIPNYIDGVLYNIYMNNYFKDIIDQKDETTFIASSNNSNIPFSVFFQYNFWEDNSIAKWYELFVTLFEYVKENSNDSSSLNLVIPTFGTNNGITYYNCAYGILFGMLRVMKNKPNLLKSFKSIKFITPYGNNNSSRVISHIFNLIHVHKSSSRFITLSSSEDSSPINEIIINPECCVCFTNKVDTLLKCGHYICCSQCLSKMEKCPYCKVKLDIVNECKYIIDKTDYVCCINGKEKVNKIFPKCKHSNLYCTDCDENIFINKSICPLCNEESDEYIKFFSL